MDKEPNTVHCSKCDKDFGNEFPRGATQIYCDCGHEFEVFTYASTIKAETQRLRAHGMLSIIQESIRMQEEAIALLAESVNHLEPYTTLATARQKCREAAEHLKSIK